MVFKTFEKVYRIEGWNVEDINNFVDFAATNPYLKVEFDTSYNNEFDGTNVDTYTVRVKVSIDDGVTNYVFGGEDTKLLTWTITPAPIGRDEVTNAIIGHLTGFVYNGNAQFVTAEQFVNAINGKYTISFAEDTNTVGTDANDYAVKLLVTVTDSNYKWNDEESKVFDATWTIAPKPIGWSDISIKDSIIKGEYNEGASYTVDANEFVDGILLDGVILWLTNDGENSNGAVGTYTAYIKAFATGNYVWDEDTAKEVKWTITRKQINITAGWIGESEVVYNGNEYNVDFEVDGGEGVVISKAYGDRRATNVDDYTAYAWIRLAAGKLASNYDIYINGVAVDLTEDYETQFDWKIVKREVSITITHNGLTMTYNGREQPFELTCDGEFEDAYDFNVIGPKTGMYAGPYTRRAEITLKDLANNKYFINGEEYIAEDESTVAVYSTEYTWRITPKVVELPESNGFEGVNTLFVFDHDSNGNPVPHELKFNMEVFDADYFDIWHPEYGNLKSSAVGNYTATVTVSLWDTHNYVLSNGETSVTQSIDWRIVEKKIDLSGLKWTDANGNAWINPVYNGKKQSVPTIIVPKEISKYIEFKFNTPGTTDSKYATNAKDYVTSVTVNLRYPDYADSFIIITDDGEGNVFNDSFEWKITSASLMDYVLSLGVNLGGRTDGTGSKVVTVDGNEKCIFVTGADSTVDIAQILSNAKIAVEYIITDANGNVVSAAKKVGSYVVTAKFTYVSETNQNYAGDASMSAKLHIVSDGNSEYVSPDGTVWIKVTDLLEFGHSIKADKVDANAFDMDALAKAITRYINNGNNYDASLIYARDIGFMFEGEDVSINNRFTVRITLPDGVNLARGEKLLVVYVSDDGKTVEVFETTDLGSYVEFRTDHFSIYAVVKATVAAPEAVEDEKIESDETGIVLGVLSGATATSWWWLWIVIAVLLVIIIVLLILLLLKKRKGDGDDDDDDTPEIEPEPETDATEAEVEETVTEEPVEEIVVVEEPVEEIVVVEEPVEEIVVVEEPVEEIVVVEEPVEEIVVVEEPAVVEEPVVEEPAGPSYAEIFAASEGADAIRLVNGVVVPVRYRTSFMSRLIQSEPPIQDYYTAVKNYVLSFKGVKARTSWNFESFNKGRIQCVKLNVKGSAFQVYLGLDPNEYSEDKYHFVNVGDKPKLDKVPLMMKVKSDRSLKYTFELIDDVMSKNGIERGDIPAVDYHMPYETTEALVDKDLVKVILPEGMQIDENTIIEKVNVGDLLKDVKPAEETVAAEAVAVEEPVVEEPVVEEPVEEIVAVEEPAVVEEPVVEEPAGPSYAEIFAASEGADAIRLVNGVVVPVRYRTSFMSRLIQSEPPIQDYYTAVKNYVLSFKGVKARTSWNFESFNKGRIQCVKLNVKGSAFQVYLGLDPNEYSEDKYHFVNVGDKPKLDKVPLMMKVKSDRSLKYTFELIDDVMSKNGIERGDIPAVDYHMPYETTEALVDKDLVKVILPEDMQIDENTIIEKVNVGALLKDVKPVVLEQMVEPVAVEPVVEEPKDEAPVVEEPVVEPAPIQIVDHHVAEEQVVFVDAVKADEIISDEQAVELIEDVRRDGELKPKTNKCYEINLDTICEVFEDGEVVDLKALKARGVIAKKAERIKVLARGTMTKKVTVVADKFSIQAVKMIGLAGGLAQKYMD